ncbi:MAG: tRNA pseudouridine(38-40) synthase TruA [Prevotella sp.]|jgi:tRNA pseudouridine38-40 synthase|nr:tRNA pseudouridine(38-40) synthase TruA [Prevotella sp.]
MMQRYFLYLSYDGANYCGWQTQPNDITVQEVIETCLSTLLRCKTPVVGAGRTDSGVHARMMTAHFDADMDVAAAGTLLLRLNGMLPEDIAIHRIVPVNNCAHARFDALSRLYRYYITTQKSPFLTRTHCRIFNEPDVDRMNICAKVLFEFEDFSSFSKSHTDVKTNNCTIMQAEWEQRGHEYIFTIKANRFLRNMVRAITGTLLDVGRGKLDEDGLRTIIRAKDRRLAGISVPAHALFLEEIEYPLSIFDEHLL